MGNRLAASAPGADQIAAHGRTGGASDAMTYRVTTKQRFYDMLGALPPAAYHAGGFLVGEPVSARTCTVTGKGAATYDAFFEIDDIHLQATEPVTMAEFMQIKAEELKEGKE